MKIVMMWIKKELPMLSGMFLITCLLLLCTYLYGENMEPAFLTLQVCGFFFILWCVVSFYFYNKRCHALLQAEKEMQHSLANLPIAVDYTEEQYQKMLQELYEECTQVKQTLMHRTSEEKDYYTLWVHQIKTPIAAMRLILQNMDDKVRAAQLAQELFKVEQYAQMALQYVRLQENGTDLDIGTCDVYETIKQVIKQYKGIFIEKKLSLVLEPFSCTTITDEKWLAFIFSQILSNALKYTNEGEIAINYEEKEEVYIISICDIGIGIQTEDLPRIFEKGFTGYNGHLDKRSTGIGLYLCKKSADMIGIPIKVESVLHKGTSVYLTIMTDCNTKM